MNNSQNSYACIACIGSISLFTTVIVVCDGKVITNEIACFNPACNCVLEVFQEKLLGNVLWTTNMSTSICNLFRAVICI